MNISQTRILVVTDPQGDAAMRSIKAYVRSHDLAWELTGFDLNGWTREADSPWLVQSGYAGVLGWCGSTMPSWVVRHRLPRSCWRASGPAAPGEVLVIPDDPAIGLLAARHFRDQGITTVAVVRHWRFQVRVQRYGPFLAAAAALGLRTLRYDPPPGLEIAEGEAHLADWLRRAPHPLGVFLHQDRDALALLRQCQDHGLEIPDQVAVLGVDDIPAAAAAAPPLSSVVMPVPAIATALAHHLHRLLAGATAGNEVVPIASMRIAARASTAPGASGDPAIDRVLTHIAASPHRPHAIASLARHAGLSQAQFYRRFQAACGATPGGHRRRCRLRQAQELLATTDLTLAEVARRCGLRTAAGLWKLFDAADLPAPARWRKAQRDGGAY